MNNRSGSKINYTPSRNRNSLRIDFLQEDLKEDSEDDNDDDDEDLFANLQKRRERSSYASASVTPKVIQTKMETGYGLNDIKPGP